MEASSWTPARVFMAVSTAFHVPVGVAGLLIDQTFPIGSGAAARSAPAHIFGVFETNGWHTVGAIVVALVSLYYLVRPLHAREGALALGISHVALVVSLMVWDPSTFWIASNAADQVVHSSTAVGGIVSALLTRRGEGARMPSARLRRAP